MMPPLARDVLRTRPRRGRRRRCPRRRPCPGSRRTRRARPAPRRRRTSASAKQLASFSITTSRPSARARSSRQRTAVQAGRVRVLERAVARRERARRADADAVGSPARARAARRRAPRSERRCARSHARARSRTRASARAPRRRRPGRRPRSSCRRGRCPSSSALREPPLRHEVAVGRRREVDDHRHVHAEVVGRRAEQVAHRARALLALDERRRRTACAPSTRAAPADARRPTRGASPCRSRAPTRVSVERHVAHIGPGGCRHVLHVVQRWKRSSRRRPAAQYGTQSWPPVRRSKSVGVASIIASSRHRPPRPTRSSRAQSRNAPLGDAAVVLVAELPRERRCPTPRGACAVASERRQSGSFCVWLEIRHRHRCRRLRRLAMHGVDLRQAARPLLGSGVDRNEPDRAPAGPTDRSRAPSTDPGLSTARGRDQPGLGAAIGSVPRARALRAPRRADAPTPRGRPARRRRLDDAEPHARPSRRTSSVTNPGVSELECAKSEFHAAADRQRLLVRSEPAHDRVAGAALALEDLEVCSWPAA